MRIRDGRFRAPGADGAAGTGRTAGRTGDGATVALLAAVMLAVVLTAALLPGRVKPAGLATSWVQAHPWPAAGIVAAAGFFDGLNPCAFTTLLLFVGGLTAAVGQASALEHPRFQRRHVWIVTGAYMAGMFSLYFGLGLGLLQLAWFRPFAGAHGITRLAGFAAVVLGVLMAREYFIPDTRLRVAVPAALHGLARRWTRRSSAGAALVAGVVIGLCTIPCGGGMYLATLGLLAAVPERLTSLALLATYNLAFVLPLALLVAVAASRPVLTAVSRWHLRNRPQQKLWLGLVVALVGLVVLLLA